MARIRTIKPEFWTDEKIVELSFAARLLFVGLWNFADDSGRMIYSPKREKMQIFPADDVSIEELVQELVVQELVEIYTVGKDSILSIPHFRDHQKIDRPTPSKIPANPREDSSSAGARVQVKTENPPREVGELSTTTPRVLDDDSRSLALEGKGKEGIKEGKGSEGIGSDEPPPGLPALSYATGVLEKLGLPPNPAGLQLVASSIETLAKSAGIPLHISTSKMIARGKRARERGDTVNRFWFEDGRFNDSSLDPKIAPSPPQPKAPARAFFPDPKLVEFMDATPDPWKPLLELLAKSINKHSFDTWFRPTRFAGVDGSKLVVRIPTDDFHHIAPRFGSAITKAIEELRFPFTDIEFYTEKA